MEDKRLISLLRELVEDKCRITFQLGSKEYGENSCRLKMIKNAGKDLRRTIAYSRYCYLGNPNFEEIVYGYLTEFKERIEKEKEGNKDGNN